MGTVVLKDQFEIDDSLHLPGYDSPTAKAYACKNLTDGQSSLVALICDADVPMRTELLEGLKNFPGPGLVKPVDSGVVNWLPTGRRQPVLICEKPLGSRVFETLDTVIQPLSDNQIIGGFLTPAIATLRELASRGLTHRNIRPSNIFYADDSARLIMLGECISAPPGYNQPLSFETLETGMANYAGRGMGTPSDDLFSLGVTLLSLLIGRLPVTKIEDPFQFMLDRINTGSYASIVGGHRIQQNMIEILRGLLADDLAERWPLSDVELWASGRRMTPKQAKLPPKAARPLPIAGFEHENIRSAAHGLSQNWHVSGDIIRGQDFDTWIQRSLNDEQVVNNLNKAIGSTQAIQSAPRAEDPRLIAKVILALDPAGPIRLGGFATHVDGIGTTLSVGFDDDVTKNQIAELLVSGVLKTWLGLQGRVKSEIMNFYGVLEKVEGFINLPGAGFGIERVLYELNPYQHCVSPMIEHLYITKTSELIPALEAVAQGDNLPPMPMDRHIAAFLSSHSEHIDERIMRPLTHKDNRPADEALKVMRILARVQSVYSNGAAPALCAWLRDLTSPAVQSFNNNKLRNQVERQVVQAAETGFVVALMRILDDAKVMELDKQNYRKAQKEYEECSAQIHRMDAGLEQKENLAGELGEQVAAVIAGVVASIGTTAIVMIYLT